MKTIRLTAFAFITAALGMADLLSQNVAPAAEPDAVYLSDLPEENPTVGYGAFGKNGQMGFLGLRISINGTRSPKGLSMHAKSNGQASVTYTLGGQHGVFKADVAVNDDAKGRQKTPLTFVIKGDDKELWRSTAVAKSGETQSATVSVSGVQKLQLIVECPGDYGYGQAVWIEPRLLKAGAAPAIAMPASTAPAAPPPPAAPAITDPRLAQLDGVFKTRLASDVQAPHEAGVNALNEKYYAALARARETAKQKGSFNEVTALDAEKQRIENKEGVPPADVQGTPPSLTALRATYRATVAKLTADRDAKAIPLYDAYLRALDAHIIELTKADKIAAAKDAQAFRDRVALDKPIAAPPAAAAAVAATTPEPATAPPMKKDAAEPVKIATSSPWREVATWALSMGAEWLQIRTGDGRLRDIRKPDDLPSGKFDVTVIKIEKRAKELTDDGFTRIALAKELRHLEIPWVEKGVPITSLKPLRGLKKLEMISLHGISNVSGAEFANLAECTALKSLDVRGSGFDDSSAAALKALPQLESFASGGHKGLTDAGLQTLAQIKSLKGLHFEYAHGFGDAGIATLGELPNLRSLTLFRVKSPDNKLTGATLGSLSKLTRLTIEDVALDPASLSGIGKIAGLQQLFLRRPGIADDAAIASLAPLSALTTLEWTGDRLTGEGFAALSAAKGLKQLVLNDARTISPAGLAAIAKAFPALESLILETALDVDAFQPADVAALAALKNLKELRLSIPRMTDAWVAECAKLGTLESLILGHMQDGAHQLTNTGLQPLTALKRLALLEIHLCPQITDDAVPALKQIKSLRRFQALRSGMTQKGVNIVNGK